MHDFTYDVHLREVSRAVGVNTLAGWVVRVAIKLHDYFMGEEREGYLETRIIRAQLKLHFAGPRTAVFKPAMSFEGHVLYPRFFNTHSLYGIYKLLYIADIREI